ncbi:MAG: C45 family autoproteolytic acyltransferase/hydrolase [Deltaproteobacteria bacterium]|nr:C45 family autoproteolytic acyltransferase/hydrolase [Deltaproteobacteria bacterium]
MKITEKAYQRPHRAKKVLKVTAAVFLCVSALILGFSWFTVWYCTAREPVLLGTPPILKESLVKDGERAIIGKSWIAKKDGILRMYLEGDPFTLGYCNAKLTQDYMQKQEESLYHTVRQFVPSKVKLWLLTLYVYWMNRNLPDYVPSDYQMEIYGLSRGYVDPFRGIASLYHRILNYHAAHDISHVVMDSPLMGCTSFAAWGRKTADGHLLVGRNFDFNPGRWFDENKIVIKVKPDRGLGFISVAWSGMAGAVSGINDAHIAVSINGARSALPHTVGTPVSLVMREVLQYARTLEEAVEIIRRSRVFVSDLYLVACGKTSRAVVVEKTPTKCAVRQVSGDFIVCANHFQTRELERDPDNLKYIAEGTSLDRYHRMFELVDKFDGSLAPEVAATILRDREVPGGNKIAYGNEAAINPLIATHSVIIDVTAGIIWVSQAPHQLGAFVPFGLANFDNPQNVRLIPPDRMLEDGSYERYLTAEKNRSRAQEFLKAGDFAGAWREALAACDLNPGYYRPWWLLGKIAAQQGKTQEAQEYLIKAQKLYPAFAHERQEIQEMLAKLTGRTAKP